MADRTNRVLTGEILKDGRILPGLALSAVAVVALAVSLYLFAVGDMAAGALSAGVAVLVGAGGVFAVLAEHHRLMRQGWRRQ